MASLILLVFVMANFRYIFPSKYAYNDLNDYYFAITKSIKENKEADFGKIFNFEWDEMYVFSYPVMYDDGLRKIGITNYTEMDDRFMSDEMLRQITFLKDKQEVFCFTYSGAYLDFGQKSVMIDRNDAVFTGKRWFNRLTLYKK